jgi:hypothetical protein
LDKGVMNECNIRRSGRARQPLYGRFVYLNEYGIFVLYLQGCMYVIAKPCTQ